eukprot:scaffold20780_cov57-Phaeocystis_antarctica.AAC.1
MTVVALLTLVASNLDWGGLGRRCALGLQALQREHTTLPRASAGAFRVLVARQQLVVEAADRCEHGRGLSGVREHLQEVALQRQDKNSSSFHRSRDVLVVVLLPPKFSLDEVEAVLRKAKFLRLPPLARD